VILCTEGGGGVKARRCHESSDELLGLICKVLDDKTLCVESRSNLAKLVVVCKFVFVKVVLERNQKNYFVVHQIF
jgi:hypothetical protein